MVSSQFYEFGEFRLDTGQKLLFRGGELVPLSPKVLEILHILVENHGRMVDKDHLLRQVWPDTFVEEGSLTRNISVLRKALGEGQENGEFIETIPKRGYRFVAPVQVSSAEAAAETKHQVPRVYGPPKDVAENPKRRMWSASFFVGMFIAAVLGAGGYWEWQRVHSTTARASGRVMLVVLPVQNLTGNPERDILSDGLTEELITQLGILNPQRLGVIARTSSMAYKGTTKRVDQIAQDLAVNYVLQASLRESGNRLRVTAQLIRTSDQTHVWAHDYDRTVRDLVALDDDISRVIAGQIKMELAPEGNARLARSSLQNPEARELYLQGRVYWNQRSREGLEKGLALFEKAIEKDPSNALAYAGIADSYNMMLFYGYAPGAVSVLRARSDAQKAVELDDSLAEGHAALGYVNFLWIWDWPEAERQFHRAAELNYNYLPGHHWHALYLSAMGRHKEAIEEIHVAQKLDPVSRIVSTAAGFIYYYARDYEEAEHACKTVLVLDPNFMAAHAVLGLTYEQKRAYPEAIAELQRALELSGGESPNYIAFLGHAYAVSGNRDEARHAIDKLDDLAKRLPFLGLSSKALIYAGLDDKEKAIQFLRAARSQNDAGLIWIRVAPQFDSLRSSPLFQQLLAHQAENP